MTNTVTTNIDRSFLLWWVLANMAGLPVLMGPDITGFFLTAILLSMADGGSVSAIWYAFIYIILALSGAAMGAWLGLWQWLAIRKHVPQAGRWILATSTGMAIGAPSGWLVYGMILDSPIVHRSDGIYLSFWYAYIAFGVSLGLTVGVAQWFALRQWVYKAMSWIVALPICFTLGMAFANFYLLSDTVLRSSRPLTERMAVYFPKIESIQMLGFFAKLSAFTALVGVGLITGILFNWLLRSHKIQKID